MNPLQKLFEKFVSKSEVFDDVPSNYWPDLIFWSLLFGCFAIFFYSLNPTNFGYFWQTLGRLIMIAGSAFVPGWIIGFIFGIPRTSPKKPEQPTTENQSENSREIQYSINTNLEDISDWLTKVVIGFTLAQLPQIGQGIMQIVDTLNNPGNYLRGFIAAIIVYFLSCGIVYGYLWGRVRLKRVDEIKGNIKVHPSDEDYQQALLNQAIYNRGRADFEYTFYFLAIAKLLHDQYFRLLDFYFRTLIQQRPK